MSQFKPLFRLPRPLDPAEVDARRREFRALRDAQQRGFLRACGVRADELVLLEPGVRAALESNTARRSVGEFLDGPKRVLVLLGGTGSGKTLAACEALLRLTRPTQELWGPDYTWAQDVDRPAPGRFIKAAAISAMGGYGEGRKDFVSLFDVPLLVVDELGGERLPLQASFDELLDERIARRHRTICTSNRPWETVPARDGNPEVPGLKDWCGQRVVSRLQAHGVLKFCREPDYRARKAGQP